MAGSVNKVILIGNVGRDPESRSFSNGGKVVEMRVATSESWKDRNSGERKEKTEWHTVKIFNEGLAGIAERYVRKGSKIYIEGSLQTRKWQDSGGNDRYSTEVILQGFNAVLTLLTSMEGGQREGGGPNRAGDSDDEWNSAAGSTGGGAGRGGGNFNGGGQRSGSFAGGFPDDLDDDVPF